MASEGDYITYSLEEAAAQSSGVVLGRVVGAQMGREFMLNPESMSPIYLPTVVAAVETKRSWFHESEAQIYVEILISIPVHRHEFTADDYLRTLQDTGTLVFLVPEPSDSETRNDGAGYPDGRDLHGLLNPQALVLEIPDGLSQPLSSDEYPLFPGASSMEEASVRLDAIN